ncbi:hypothetical protein MNBD_GAMMA15-308 [hydrothermal vent metagenome]|uniref:Thioredoxin-like fold domain-containing protein n=1 Tax=hydrothermal vent metagenome TaxID=652676 RepID=A0A3B0Y249_9ZZZZ
MKINIEVFTISGCGRCSQAATLMDEICAELGSDQIQWQAVDVVENIDRAVELGVLATPAIAVNNLLAFTGMPSKSALLKEIKRLIQTGD